MIDAWIMIEWDVSFVNTTLGTINSLAVFKTSRVQISNNCD